MILTVGFGRVMLMVDDKFVQARRAYKSYRCVYKEVREYLDAPDATVSYREDGLTKRYQEAHENLLKALDELFPGDGKNGGR